jgi:hypothetical protein
VAFKSLVIVQKNRQTNYFRRAPKDGPFQSNNVGTDAKSAQEDKNNGDFSAVK